MHAYVLTCIEPTSSAREMKKFLHTQKKQYLQIKNTTYENREQFFLRTRGGGEYPSRNRKKIYKTLRW